MSEYAQPNPRMRPSSELQLPEVLSNISFFASLERLGSVRDQLEPGELSVIRQRRRFLAMAAEEQRGGQQGVA
jgi:hypothetical protein